MDFEPPLSAFGTNLQLSKVKLKYTEFLYKMPPPCVGVQRRQEAGVPGGEQEEAPAGDQDHLPRGSRVGAVPGGRGRGGGGGRGRGVSKSGLKH